MAAAKRGRTTASKRAIDSAAGAGPAAGLTESRAARLAGIACLSLGMVSQTLAGAVAAGRVSHAYLLAAVQHGLPLPGDDGVDRAMSAAITFARRLNCEAPLGDAACGKCLSCRLVADGNHPDIRIVSPDGLSVKIDQIRELKREMSLTPRRAGGIRVTIVENAEKMTTEAQNSLLKVLEEPPEGAVLVLVSSNPAGLLPTVRSRCQSISVRPAGMGGRDVAAECFRGLVEAARRAREMSPIQVLDVAEALEAWARSGSTGATDASPGARARADEGANEGRTAGAHAGAKTPSVRWEPRQGLEAALVAAVAWFRDVLVYKKTGDIALTGSGGSTADTASELAMDATLYSVDDILRVIDVIEEARRRVRRNVNMRLALEAMLFTLRKHGP